MWWVLGCAGSIEWSSPANDPAVDVEEPARELDFPAIVSDNGETWGSIFTIGAAIGKVESEEPRVLGETRTRGWKDTEIGVVVETKEGLIWVDELADWDMPLEVEMEKGKIDSWKTTSCDTKNFQSQDESTYTPCDESCNPWKCRLLSEIQTYWYCKAWDLVSTDTQIF